MTLQINLGQSDVTLKLLKNPALEKDGRLKLGQRPVLFKGGVDFETAKYYHDLSEVLISALDKLLKRNKLDPKSLKSYKMHSDLGQDSTSYKIASAFIEALKFRDI